jgi:thiol-disulfide isomerase/thioredoxin
MPTRKQKPRHRGVRRHRTSVAGKILPPVDVRLPKHLKDFEKRIKAGPITILFVYATWCPHCHTMMPHFDAAAKSANRSIQAVKINEEMLPAVNSFVNSRINKSAKPLNVEGYPSIIVVNKQGEKVTDIEPIRDTEVMTKIMSNAGPLAKQAGLNSVPAATSMNTDEVESVSANTNNSANLNALIKNNKNANKNAVNKDSNTNMLKNLGISQNGMVSGTPRNINIGEEELRGSIASEDIPKEAISVSKNTNNTKNTKNVIENDIDEIATIASPVVPPSMNSDSEEPVNPIKGGGKGGSLYSAMARTAYTLAPAAILLATAATVIKNKKRKTLKQPKRYIKKSRKHTKRYTRR